MRETQWIEWTQTRLEVREREDLLGALTAEQRAHLLSHDYVWAEGIGLLWKPQQGGLEQRARFTHGSHFRTRKGEFYVDAEGGVRELSRSA
jgi:hypothetical protein